MMFLRRTCQEVAALLVAREDRPLGLEERWALRLHLAACDACPTFERQILLMRNSLRQWRTAAASDDSDAPQTTPK